jgi:hypothetical protein
LLLTLVVKILWTAPGWISPTRKEKQGVARDETETREACGRRSQRQDQGRRRLREHESTQERRIVIKCDALLDEEEGRFVYT